MRYCGVYGGIRRGGYLVLASERGGNRGDAEVGAGVESLDGGLPVLLEEGADDANLSGVVDDVGEEGVEVVAGALVIVGVVEHRLRVEFLPELAAREGEAEGLDGLLVRHAEGGSLWHLLLGHELHGDVVLLRELGRDGLGLALLPGAGGLLVGRSLRVPGVGSLQGNLGSVRDRVGVGHVAAHSDDDGDHTDDHGGGGEEGGVLLLLLPEKSCERRAGRAKHLSIPRKVLRVRMKLESGDTGVPGARAPARTLRRGTHRHSRLWSHPSLVRYERAASARACVTSVRASPGGVQTCSIWPSTATIKSPVRRSGVIWTFYGKIGV